ncbi:MAG: MBL fold metallo-hydrolase [Roseibium sp.]
MQIERTIGFPEPGDPGLFWLGQAGFWIETGDHRILIDPYLSDSLARKYAGKKNPHIRMELPIIRPENLPCPDLVLITHAHTDHLDADSLAPVFQKYPNVPFVVPIAHEAIAHERIDVKAKLILVDAGDRLAPLDDLSLDVFPAAHETVAKDDAGHHLFLGYGITTNRFRIYHSGDCVPFDGLEALVNRFLPDIALLPVNGRCAERKADGVPGNFTLEEAISLSAKSRFLVPHHFGMFDFNTIDPVEIDAKAETYPKGSQIIRPNLGESLRILN